MSRSRSLVDQFEDHFFDWIYIDGDHTYEAVLQDLRSYLPKIKLDGFLCGDDYDRAGWWDNGVTRAVEQFADEQDLSREIVGSQYILKLKTN